MHLVDASGRGLQLSPDATIVNAGPGFPATATGSVPVPPAGRSAGTPRRCGCGHWQGGYRRRRAIATSAWATHCIDQKEKEKARLQYQYGMNGQVKGLAERKQTKRAISPRSALLTSSCRLPRRRRIHTWRRRTSESCSLANASATPDRRSSCRSGAPSCVSGAAS